MRPVTSATRLVTAANAIKRSATVYPSTRQRIERMAEAEAQARFDDHLNAEQEAALADDFDPQSAGRIWDMRWTMPSVLAMMRPTTRSGVNALLAQAGNNRNRHETLREDAARETLNQSEQTCL